MYLFFTDESGNTGSNLLDPDQPYHYICGIYIQDDRCLALQESIENIAKGIFDPLPPNFEFKGSWLYSGNSFFEQLSPAQRIQIVDDLIDLLEQHDLNYIISIINKPAHHARYIAPFHPQNLATLFLLEMFQEILNDDGTLGLVVCDEEESQGDEIILDFKKYKEQGTGFSTYKSVELTRIIDNIHFVDSRNSWPLQLTDVILYFLNRGRRMLIEKGLLLHPNPDLSQFSPSERAVYDHYVKIRSRQRKLKIFP